MIKFYDTLRDKKVEFKARGNEVKIYLCGPTVYDHAHLGHARSAIVFDVIRRWFEYRGFNVIFVRNYTDIDDKIINRANEEKTSWKDISERFIKSYEEDMKALNVKEPTFKPKVSEHIEDIIQAVRKLIEKGFAYEAEGNVYFRVKKFKDYGKLSKKTTEQLLAGARVEPGEGKEDPLDFALWKKSKEGEPGWESPWGKGRPGWHIECSVMAMKYLGETIDIHGGGMDLIFPHHENEIAQSESLTGKEFSRYWIHNGFVMVNNEKMSKSLGNFFTVKELLKNFSPNAIRLFILSTHYRSPINFSLESLKSFESAFEKIKGFLAFKEEIDKFEEDLSEFTFNEENFLKEFESAMDDDFNTAKAIAVVFEVINAVNPIKTKAYKTGKVSKSEKDAYKKAVKLVEKFLKILGFKLEEEKKESKEDKLIELLVKVRSELRRRKIYDLADAIRTELSELGIILEDTPTGTVFRRK